MQSTAHQDAIKGKGFAVTGTTNYRVSGSVPVQTIESTPSPLSVQIEERSLGSSGLNRYELSAGTSTCFLQESVRQVFDGRSSKEGGERDLLATNLLKTIDHADGE